MKVLLICIQQGPDDIQMTSKYDSTNNAINFALNLPINQSFYENLFLYVNGMQIVEFQNIKQTNLAYSYRLMRTGSFNYNFEIQAMRNNRVLASTQTYTGFVTPPQSVENIIITQINNDTFRLSWKQPAQSDYQNYFTVYDQNEYVYCSNITTNACVLSNLSSIHLNQISIRSDTFKSNEMQSTVTAVHYQAYQQASKENIEGTLKSVFLSLGRIFLLFLMYRQHSCCTVF
jgi:hypothetical protein